MRQFRLPARLSDEEFVERTRRSLGFFDRSRRWLMAMWVLIAIVIFGFVTFGVATLQKMAAQPGPVQLRSLSLLVGLMLGVFMGASASHIGHGLGTILFGFRAQRLLIKYYDELQLCEDGGDKRELHDC